MPVSADIKKVLVIGSGPIVIGQAAEFDYAGTQACRSLREEGIEVVLMNSNPATIMTDTQIADHVYVEPLTVEFASEVIKIERPDGILPTLGGQTGLNLATELATKGVLDKHNVRLLGTSLSAIRMAEDRAEFRSLMRCIGEPVPESWIIQSVEEISQLLSENPPYPLIVRPAYTLGGTGGGIAHNADELLDICKRGMALSMRHQVMVERSLIGWKEIEYEVMRDGADNCITICNMENLDPMGVHTGDSIVVAPSQTLSDKEYQMLRTAALKIIRALRIEGGCNVQFALSPHSYDYYVIEVNPRVSRSSALASKATGYPIARVSAKIAVGLRLDEIPNAVTKETLACFEPVLDYCVVKIPRWPFDKFVDEQRVIGTQMRATGEVMAIDRNFEAALMKAIRSTETGMFGLIHKRVQELENNALIEKIKTPNDERLFAIAEALRRGLSVSTIANFSSIDPWFIQGIKHIVEIESEIKERADDLRLAGASLSGVAIDLLRKAKIMGFPDKLIGQLTGQPEMTVRQTRKSLGIVPTYKMVDTCAAEFEAQTPYYYSCYEEENEVSSETSSPATTSRHKRGKVVVLGSGPIRIGQGIEFDYCSVHCVWALREAGYEPIIINNNPETVSTDFDTSDRLYFEPLTTEDVLNVIDLEAPEGVIVQFGGQTPLNIASDLASAGVTILGTSQSSIDLAEDREQFAKVLSRLDIPQPESGAATSLEEALEIAKKIGYPLMVRPSYVLGGRGMEIIYGQEDLTRYVNIAVCISPEHPVLIDKFLDGAIEAEVDVICDGHSVFIPAIMEHIEPAGIHSGDSACVIPPISIRPECIEKIIVYAERIAKALDVVGILNIQYAITGETVYVLEANPRASRTVPLVAKVTGIPVAKIATQAMLGVKLTESGYNWRAYKHFGVKESVFPFGMFRNTDPRLGPEMRSTGEVLGLADSFSQAYYKAQAAVGLTLPTSGTVLVTVADRDKPDVISCVKTLVDLGFRILATSGTRDYLSMNGISAERINKLHEGSPNITDAIRDGHIQLIINTPAGRESVRDDSYIRKAAVTYKVPYVTTIAAAAAAVEAIGSACEQTPSVKSLVEYYRK